jgi:OmpA-OmpF porin, OOP family
MSPAALPLPCQCPPRRQALRPALLLLSLSAALALPVFAQDNKKGPQPVGSVPIAAPANNDTVTRTASIPAKGLFVGDQLSDSAKSRLTDLIINALGLDVQVALIVPTGPWQLEDSGKDERDLTPARLNAVRKFLSERGVDPKRVFVESRVDLKIKEPRLDVQLVAKPAND